MCARLSLQYICAPEAEKATEALECANAMFRAQAQRGG
jgi:hypothetical protein